MAPPVTATAAALAMLDQLSSEHGPLMLFQSGGCCDGSSPILLKDGELSTGPNDVRLGEIGGVGFYVDSEQWERWKKPRFLIDVGAGPAMGFSLCMPDAHLVTRSPE